MRRIGDIADIRTVSRVVISFEYYLPQEGKQPKRGAPGCQYLMFSHSQFSCDTRRY